MFKPMSMDQWAFWLGWATAAFTAAAALSGTLPFLANERAAMQAAGIGVLMQHDEGLVKFLTDARPVMLAVLSKAPFGQ